MHALPVVAAVSDRRRRSEIDATIPAGRLAQGTAMRLLLLPLTKSPSFTLRQSATLECSGERSLALPITFCEQLLQLWNV